MHTQADLLRQQCESDQIDADAAHARIPDKGTDTWFALSAVERMFLENIELLKSDIRTLQLQ